MIRRPLFASSREAVHQCLDCGLQQVVPAMPPYGEASCLRCEASLRRNRPNWERRVLAATLTSSVLYLIAITAPFLTVDIVGRVRRTTMLSLPSALAENGAWELGAIVLFTAILMPAAKIASLLFVMLGLRSANPPRILPQVFRWYRRIGPWAMVEVFLLGVFVAYTRLGAIATVNTGIALYAVAALMVTTVMADFLIDSEGAWDIMEEKGLVPRAPRLQGIGIACHSCRRVSDRAEGDDCDRCGARLHVRKPNSAANTWAMLAAAATLYLPANLFPVMTVTRLGQGQASTILGGARELLDAGMWPLALLVFVASFAVPLFKLVSLAAMLASAHRHSDWRLQDRTRIFRLVDFIGRWSMIDVFMLATLVSLVQAGIIATIRPNIGAICFGSVVVLTMLAVEVFDPRIMWDAAGANAGGTEPAEAGGVVSPGASQAPVEAGAV